jgi:hypothetical protein
VGETGTIIEDEDFTPRAGIPERTVGTAPTGSVGLRNFDEGIVETLQPEIINDNYYLTKVPNMASPVPGSPGIPIVFAYPEDLYERYKLPVVVIRRDDLSPALSRWHPGMVTYKSPAANAVPVEVTLPDGSVSRGYSRYEVQQQAVPYDITYTISLLARHRGFGKGSQGAVGAGSPRNQVNRLLDYVMRIYQPYSQVVVRDSLGDARSYAAFMESTSHLDEVADVTDRVIGFALTLRVEAELDLRDPREKPVSTGVITPNELGLELK